MKLSDFIETTAMTTGSKVGSLCGRRQFISSEYIWLIYKSVIRSYIVYYCFIWSCFPTIYLVILDKTQRSLCNVINHDFSHSYDVNFLCLIYEYFHDNFLMNFPTCCHIYMTLDVLLDLQLSQRFIVEMPALFYSNKFIFSHVSPV